jgi:hypothetical protein
MISIGIRASSKKIYYSVVEKENSEFMINNNSFIVPQALNIPDRLSYIRNSFESIIIEFRALYAGIRISEMIRTTTTTLIERSYIEGVLQELFSNCSINYYFAGRKNTIAKLLSTSPQIVSSYIDGDVNFMDIETWKDFKKEEREAIISAFAAFECRGIYG